MRNREGNAVDRRRFVEQCVEHLNCCLQPFGVTTRGGIVIDEDPLSRHWWAEFRFSFTDSTCSPPREYAAVRRFSRLDFLLDGARDEARFRSRLPSIAKQVVTALMDAVMQSNLPPVCASGPGIWSGCPTFLGVEADTPVLVPKAPEDR